MRSRTRQTTMLHTGIAVRWPASTCTNPDYSEMPVDGNLQAHFFTDWNSVGARDTQVSVERGYDAIGLWSNMARVVLSVRCPRAAPRRHSFAKRPVTFRGD